MNHSDNPLRAALAAVLPLATAHVEDWRTGVEDGTYEDRDGLPGAAAAVESATAMLAGLPPLPVESDRRALQDALAAVLAQVESIGGHKLSAARRRAYDILETSRQTVGPERADALERALVAMIAAVRVNLPTNGRFKILADGAEAAIPGLADGVARFLDGVNLAMGGGGAGEKPRAAESGAGAAESPTGDPRQRPDYDKITGYDRDRGESEPRSGESMADLRVRELASIRAALEWYFASRPLPAWVNEFATLDDTIEPLSAEEIATLSDRINAQIAPGEGETVGRYLIAVEGGIEASLHGPYDSAAAREAAGRPIYDAQDAATDSMFWLDIDDRGRPDIGGFGDGMDDLRAGGA